jgi:hypothetical protein
MTGLFLQRLYESQHFLLPQGSFSSFSRTDFSMLIVPSGESTKGIILLDHDHRHYIRSNLNLEHAPNLEPA